MDPEAYLHRKAKRPGPLQKKGDSISRQQESRVAARLGVRPSRNSGAGRIPARGSSGGITKLRVGGKGDVPTDLLLLECKTTGKASISLQQGHLIKISREAGLHMKSPAMVLSFPVMPEDVERDWLVVPLAVWERLHGKP
jgi:hypothetical protein